MGISIEQYRQRIGCFTTSGSFKGIRYEKILKETRLNGFRTVMRLICLVALVSTVLASSLFILDLTQFGDVEKNPGPNSDQKYKFHLITSDDFENLAAIVLEDKYKRPFHVYKGGRDGGIDAEASNIGFLTNEKIIVQVKHTSNASGTLTESTRKSVFEKEKPKVEKLVKDNKLETYVIFTNYPLPAIQAQHLKECFKDAGAKNVEVVGYETLCNWLNGSHTLEATLIARYPVINPASIVNTTVNYQCTFSSSNENGPSPPKRLKSEPDIKALKEVLCDEYKYRASRFQPLPWIDKMLFKLEDVFTKLSIVKRRTYGWEKTDQIVEPSDMFDQDEESMSKPRIILIEGSPGTGKTTLSLKLAYDWAMGQMPNKFPEVELVLLIKCRDMKDSIQESAKTQLLPWDNDELRNVLDSFLHSGKIMLIVDGVDEISKSAESHVVNLLNRKCLKKCYVVLTSRQEKGMEVRKYCDKLLEIEGYSYKSIKSYINKYFGSNIDLAKKLRKKVRPKTENNLRTLATNPLNTLLLCVVFEDNGGYLPTTVTELYQNIVECIWKRYCQKKRPEEKDTSFEIAKQTLGRLAYESLIEHDTLYFRESRLGEDEIQCTKIGFLYKDDISTKMLSPSNTYWFLHKTFQEYFAAYHCVYTETELDLSKLSHYTRKGGAKFIQALKFMSSMLQKKNAEDHKEFLKQLAKSSGQVSLSILCAVLSENDLDKDIAGTVKTFIPRNLIFKVKSGDPYNRYFFKIMPRILGLLGTEVKGEDNQKVELSHIEFNGLTNGTECLKLICEALMKNLVVDKLRLFHCKSEVNYLAKMLSENSNVRKFDLTDNGITNEGVNILAKSLYKNTTLESLTLFKNDLAFKNESPSKFTGMSEMLATNDKLEELWLGDNPLGSAGVTWIAEALESNERVKHLGLGVPAVTTREQQHLQKC